MQVFSVMLKMSFCTSAAFLILNSRVLISHYTLSSKHHPEGGISGTCDSIMSVFNSWRGEYFKFKDIRTHPCIVQPSKTCCYDWHLSCWTLKLKPYYLCMAAYLMSHRIWPHFVLLVADSQSHVSDTTGIRNIKHVSFSIAQNRW